MSKPGRILKLCGVLLMIAAVGLTAFNLLDAHRAGEAAQHTVRILTDYIEKKDPVDIDAQAAVISPALNVPEMPAHEIDGLSYIGVLDIPELNLTLPVSAYWDYSALRVTPCRYSGSAYEQNLVICAHNYSTHFGTLYELREGAQATFTDCNGTRFFYALAEIENIDPTGVERMTDSGSPLTLFTCNWNGTERVTLRFDLVRAEA